MSLAKFVAVRVDPVKAENSMREILIRMSPEQDLLMVFDLVFSNTIDYITTHTTISPYMIAIAYVRRIALENLETKPGICQRFANGIGRLRLQSNIDYLLKKIKVIWLINPVGFDGFAYMTDVESSNIMYLFPDSLMVGTEFDVEKIEVRRESGAAPLVAHCFVAFAINRHFNLYAKQSAEFNDVYTSTIIHMNISKKKTEKSYHTITARSLADLERVSNKCHSAQATARPPRKIVVLISLGEKNFETDEVLHGLGETLAKMEQGNRYEVEYFLNNDILTVDSIPSLETVKNWLKTKELWTTNIYQHKNKKKFKLFAKIWKNLWLFAITAVGTVEGTQTNEAISITVPIPGQSQSGIEIIRHPASTQSLFAFVRSIVGLDYWVGLRKAKKLPQLFDEANETEEPSSQLNNNT